MEQPQINIYQNTGTVLETIEHFLENELVPEAVTSLNDSCLQRRLLVFDDEKLPTNQRNLTDFRTRLGVLIEYEFGRALDELLASKGLTDAQVVYVVANRFPDLEIRRSDGTRGPRIEVKSIDLLAEEKAANFDTLVKDTRPSQDYVLVLLWQWLRVPGKPARCPVITDWSIINAFELAVLRDTYWLNHPPGDCGDGAQGFDIRWAVNSTRAGFNKEEGNYGKLMRIFDSQSEQWLPNGLVRQTTVDKYFTLRQKIWKGGHAALVEILSEDLVSLNNGTFQVQAPTEHNDLLVWELSIDNRRVVLGGGNRMPRKVDILALVIDNTDIAVAVNAKFQWRVYDSSGNLLNSGNKPTAIAAAIAQTLGVDISMSDHLF